MPKVSRTGGASLNDGTRPRTVDRRGAVDVELSGPDADLSVGGELTIGGEGVATVARHDWAVRGWRGFTPVTITADGAQAFTATSSSGKGIVTAAASTAPNLRVAYLRDGTSWRDSVVTSLLHGPIADWDGSNAQQGHVHRVREISPGQWEGIAVWTSVVFGGDYSFLHCNSVRFDGTTLLQGTAPVGTFGTTDAAYIDRSANITAIERTTTLGSYFNDYRLLRPHLLNVDAGDIVTIASVADTSFNQADIALLLVDKPKGTVRVVDPSDTTLQAYLAVKNGTVTPSSVDLQKRWAPFWLSTRVIGGTASSVTVEAKRWRPDEPEPGWSEPRVQRGAVTPSASLASLAVGTGRCGLWAAHMHTTSGGAWGDVKFERVPAWPGSS